MKTRAPAGFTLLEMLVVIGLVSVLALALAGGLSGSGKSAALQAGQASVVNLLLSARTRALASGLPTRLLVHTDPQSPLASERYLRCLALEQQQADGTWQTLQTVQLPPSIYVLPHQNRTPGNLFGGAAAWTKLDGSRLHSSCLSQTPLAKAIDGPVSESWVPINFAVQGTTGTSGFLVVATGRPLAPADYGAGDSPVVLQNQEAVRGLQLSGYGLAILIHDRTGF
jgi:prepilin-type N-terminal cleavage/methylation domain-containing protein